MKSWVVLDVRFEEALLLDSGGVGESVTGIRFQIIMIVIAPFCLKIVSKLEGKR